jgi:hypothetical protein
MATKKKISFSEGSVISSIKDGAYQQATATQKIRDFAGYCIDNVAGFPDSLPDETKEQLYQGYQLRYSQNNDAVTYAVINSHYIKANEEHYANEKIEKIELSVAYVMSFSPQEFGKIKNDNPELHTLIKELRDKVGIYCSNRKNDLVRTAKNIISEKEGKTKTRTANKDFDESITALFESFDTKLKTAKSRGDITADENRYKKAKLAFLAIWKPNA